MNQYYDRCAEKKHGKHRTFLENVPDFSSVFQSFSPLQTIKPLEPRWSCP
jgi:hypothetical protein